MQKKSRRNPSVIIIGAGMTGILMTIKLREAGITDITILEKKQNLGGTWRENSYPGVACDVPAHMYTYSFEPNPEWSNRFAKGSEIQDYFEKVGRKYGVTEKIRFDEAVVDSQYRNGKWHVKTSKGESMVSDFLIAATGILHHPATPDIKGLDSFGGDCFHTANWNHEVDLKGKKIGVIGTGSTAAQVIPELIKEAGKVSVFQRTAQWIVKLPNRRYSEEHKANWRQNPQLMTLLNNRYSKVMEQTFSKAVTGHKIQHLLVSLACKLNLRLSIKDPVLRKKLTPSYTVGCKRLIGNDTFYKAIQKPNADLVTQGIECITEKGILTKDGQLHELEVLVLSTGFKPFNFMRPMNLVGKNGVHINDVWEKKVKAYRSICIPEFPNFFLMLGPNTPIGNYSVIAMSEVQTDYVLKLIERWRLGEFDEVAATSEALQDFNAYLKQGMGKTAWVGGCQSWYLDDDGDPAMWPYSWNQWVKEMKEPKLSDFALSYVSENVKEMAS
ncbi:MAG: NAD(P)/FAD-dependent oxidoreductase [Bermanella sp.]